MNEYNLAAYDISCEFIYLFQGNAITDILTETSLSPIFVIYTSLLSIGKHDFENKTSWEKQRNPKHFSFNELRESE